MKKASLWIWRARLEDGVTGIGWRGQSQDPTPATVTCLVRAGTGMSVKYEESYLTHHCTWATRDPRHTAQNLPRLSEFAQSQPWGPTLCAEGMFQGRLLISTLALISKVPAKASARENFLLLKHLFIFIKISLFWFKLCWYVVFQLIKVK